MSAAVADLISANLKGQRKASELIDQIRRGMCHPDVLDVEVSWIGDPDVRRGFLRAVQKAVERAG